MKEGKTDLLEAEEISSRFILPELEWLVAQPPPVDALGVAPRMRLSRSSKAQVDTPIEFTASHEETAHVLSYPLRQLNYQFTLGGNQLLDTVITPNRVFLLPPVNLPRRGVYRSPFHSVRIFLPPDLISECYQSMYGRLAPSGVELFNPRFITDPVVVNFVRALVVVDENGSGPTFIDAVGLALTSRLITLSKARLTSVAPSSHPLPTWRLKRTIEFLDAHLREPIGLGDLSAVAGLSRMRFASQFRAAVGDPPYTYIIKRRIEEAQKLLLDPSWTIAAVASEMGFADQAHFTRMFRKIVGVTPHRWRMNVTD